MIPATKIVVDRAARRQVLRHRPPLATRAEHIHQPVDHLAHVHRPLVASALGSRDHRRNQRPFLIGQVARIAQLAAVVASAVLVGPHPKAPANRSRCKRITTDSADSTCSWTDTKAFSRCFMVVRSWRCQTQRTPAGEIDRPRLASSLATRSWPQAGWSTAIATTAASMSGA